MDLPGFGASRCPRETITIGGYAAAVDELLGVLGVTRATVVGNSMGGFIGAELAIRFGTWVEKLVSVSAAGLTIEHQRNERALAVLRRGSRLLALGNGLAGVEVRRARTAAALAPGDAQRRRRPSRSAAGAAGGRAAAWFRWPGFIDALDALTNYPIRDRLGDIAAPTLVVWGAKDLLVPVRDAWKFGELIPDSRVVVYEDTGHVAMMERPVAFNALVQEFLGDTGPEDWVSSEVSARQGAEPATS